jgi:hypothetical protein
MVPKMNQRPPYASEPRIPFYRSIAMDQGKKPVTGHIMVLSKGQELRQITVCLSVGGRNHEPGKTSPSNGFCCKHASALVERVQEGSGSRLTESLEKDGSTMINYMRKGE